MIRFSHSVFALPFALTAAVLAGRDGIAAAAGLLDRGGHGGGAQRGHGHEPPRRSGVRRAEPAHRRARAAPGRALARGGLGLRRRSRRPCSCSPPAMLNPLCLALVARGSRHRLRLLVHEAFHLALAPRARTGPGGRPGWRLARHPGLDRLAAPRPRPRRAPLGGRLRRDLRLPGRRGRPARGPTLAAGPARRGPRAALGPASSTSLAVACCSLSSTGSSPSTRSTWRAWRRWPALLAFEHSLVRPDDLSRVMQAFNLNGWVSLGYFASTLLAVLLA